VFLDLRIVRELQAYFSDLRILQGLGLEWNLAAGIAKRPTECDAFELLVEVTRTNNVVVTICQGPFWE
jgi:hypothetical protein